MKTAKTHQYAQDDEETNAINADEASNKNHNPYSSVYYCAPCNI